MPDELPATTLQLRSLVRSDGTLQLTLDEVPVPQPGEGEVVIRVEAAPINPSDLGLLLAGADMGSAISEGSPDRPMVTAAMSEPLMRLVRGRVGTPMPVGNEGAGTVVVAGSSARAQALLGRTVAVAAGAMYSQYRCVPVATCLEIPDGIRPAEAASSFVNPLTALGMIETMRLEHHTGLVHTAAASNLGQMLNRLCLEEKIPLVSIVRRQEQEDLLRAGGATHVCISAAPNFTGDLIAALTETSATLAFDAVGGGKLAGQILTCMEVAAGSGESYSRYGSSVHKQVYIYGGLDRSPTELGRSFGMAWGVGGWLLTPFLARIGPEATDRLRRRVAEGLRTTFSSSYTDTVSLAEALRLDTIAGYARQATGSKYLITPNS
ncbi:MAG: zinc-binding dehydrogenase [Acidimicrobiales bacterium]